MRDVNGAAAIRRAIQTARRRFDARFKRRGGDLTRDFNGAAAAIRRAIQTARRRQINARFKQRGGVSTRNLNDAAAIRRAI
jgi:hypothetical protein